MAQSLKRRGMRRRNLAMLAACTCAAALPAWGDTFQPFPTSSVHIQAAVLAAAADIPAGTGTVYSAGDPNDINVVNFGTTIYTGPVDVTTTIERLQNDQSVYLDESDDGGFFNFNPGELPNIP